MSKSQYLDSLSSKQRKELEQRLFDSQQGYCFICEKRIDLVLQKDDLQIDHIDPLAEDGLDSQNNFALVHGICNRTKSASNLEVARRLMELESLQSKLREQGKRGANLGHILRSVQGSNTELTLKITDNIVSYSLPKSGDSTIHQVPLFNDKLSGMQSFFANFPIEYLYHDEKINPRSIGVNIRGLIDEFIKRRPQLHVALAWWGSEESGNTDKVHVFDGQHKAAAQILLGNRSLPVRVFVRPDRNVLLQTNTNAGGKLRQVAFDQAVMRHLGSSMYADRIRQYREMRGLTEEDYSFSENDLVKFYRGERREMLRYIVDAQRDSISSSLDNKLIEFVEWSGKTASRPLAYNSIERSFFKEFLFMKGLDSAIGAGMEEGTNPRLLERDQLVRLMSLFSEIFFVNQWDPEIGGRRIEARIVGGEKIPESHLRAWRIAREEVLSNVVRWLRLVITNYYAFIAIPIHEDRLLHQQLPDELWSRLHNFLENLKHLPCWVDHKLSTTIFGPRQNLDFWAKVFSDGSTPLDIPILTKGLDMYEMIQDRKIAKFK